MGKEGRGRKAAGGRGERGRAAGEGAGAAAAGLPRLPRSVRPALARSLARPLPVLLPRPPSPRLGCLPWLWPRLLPPCRAGVTLPPASCASASFHTNTNSSTPSPDLAAAAAATLCSGSASRDFRGALDPAPSPIPHSLFRLSLLPRYQSQGPSRRRGPAYSQPGSSRLGGPPLG